MAGVKGKSGSGGARPGAGVPRKVRTVSERMKGKILRAANKLSKEYGEPIEQAMLRMCYQPNVQDSVKASVFKTYLDSIVAKESEKNVKITGAQGPAIYLPPRMEDPALKVHTGGKK